MDFFIIFIRTAIWLTFLLLIVEGITAIIVIRKFYAFYMRRHIALEARVEAVERRLGLAEKHEA